MYLNIYASSNTANIKKNIPRIKYTLSSSFNVLHCNTLLEVLIMLSLTSIEIVFCVSGIITLNVVALDTFSE